MTPRPIRILVVDDHFLPRLAVTTLVAREPDLEVVGEAETGWQAGNLAKQLAPDVVLMDLRLPELDGVAASAALTRDVPGAAVLVLSHYEGTEDVNRALAAGDRGYVKKDVDGAVVLEAVRQVAAGKRFIPPEVGARLAESVGREPLTRRELEILQLV